MSFLEYHDNVTPQGWRKILHLNWGLLLLIIAVVCVGLVQLFSVAGGSWEPWADAQSKRFALGLCVMFCVAMVPIWLLRNMSAILFAVSVALLLAVEFFGVVGMGAQRWIDLGFMRLQPSELTKITLVMALAAYYDWLPRERTSHPIWVLLPVIVILVPVILTLKQPDLGTAILLLAGGGGVMFLAGVHWAYFATVIAAGIGGIVAVMQSKGTDWQLLKDYQYRRIDTFLDPESNPLGAGYHITQSKIALGSGGWTGRGFMQGTQSRLGFLPEKHTDFIFTSLAEEFGFIGALILLGLYALILIFCVYTGLRTKDRFASLVTLGIAITFFLFLAVNMSMVMGLMPVVGVPLPLVSYGGSALLVLMVAFGVVQSAHVHTPKQR